MFLPQQGKKLSARLRQVGHGARPYEQLAGRHLDDGSQADIRACTAVEKGLGGSTVGGRSAHQVFTAGAGDCVTGDATGDDAGFSGGTDDAGDDLTVIPTWDPEPSGRGRRGPLGQRAPSTEADARWDESIPPGVYCITEI